MLINVYCYFGPQYFVPVVIGLTVKELQDIGFGESSRGARNSLSWQVPTFQLIRVFIWEGWKVGGLVCWMTNRPHVPPQPGTASGKGLNSS